MLPISRAREKERINNRRAHVQVELIEGANTNR